MFDESSPSAQRTSVRLLVRVEEAARLCDLSRSRMYELIQSGEVPSVGIGRSRRVPVAALNEWIRQMVEAQGVRR